MFISHSDSSVSMPTSRQTLFVCEQCKAFCCNLVRPPITEQEKQDILEAGFSDYFIDVGNGIYDIKPAKDGTCPYLKRNYSCEIHRVKPKLCRIWPVIPRYKDNKRGCIVVKCPLFPYMSKKEIQQAKKVADTIPPAIIKHLWDISSEMKKKYKRFQYQEI